MDWLYLLIAGVLEVGWVVGLKYTEGFTRFWPSVPTVAAMIGSMACLALAVRSVPLGTGYAIWTGIGTLGAVAFGMLLWNEPVTFARLVFIVLIVTGIIGLKLSSH